jgi:hypothetical protein
VDIFPTLPESRRRELCLAAGAALGLDAPSIEKDFWVCWTLRELFALPEIGPHLTFKGGTSLSKCWKIIERFSEDIDVVIDRDFLGFGGEQAPERAPSSKKRNAGIEALKSASRDHVRDVLSPALQQSIATRLPAGLAWRVTDDDADPDAQTLLFEYGRDQSGAVPRRRLCQVSRRSMQWRQRQRRGMRRGVYGVNGPGLR